MAGTVARPSPTEMMVVLDQRIVAFFRTLASDAPLAGPSTPDTLARVGAANAAHGIRVLAAA